MVKEKIYSAKKSALNVLNNLGKMLLLAWRADKGLVTGFYLTSGIGAFFPIFTSFVYKLLVDSVIEHQGISPTIPFVVIAILGARFVADAIQGFVMWGLRNTYFDFLFRYKIQNALNYEFFSKTADIDIAHLENPKTQDLIAKAKDTFTWRPPDFLRQFSYFFTNLVSFIAVFFILVSYNWWMPVVITLMALPRLFLRTKFGNIQWSIYGSGAPEVRKIWYLTWLLSNKVAVTEGRIFQSSKVLLARFKKIQDYLYKINKKPVVDFMKVAFYPDVLEIAVIFVFAYLRLPQVLAGEMSVGDFTFFVSLLDRIRYNAGDLILNFGEMYENNLYVNHFFEVMNLPKLIKKPTKPKSIGETKTPPKIEFKNVSFTYPGGDKPALEDVSFVINPAENVALVGRNGAGKTTIVKLLCRFYDVASGKILINGINIKEVDLSQWYSYIGTLFQEFIQYDFTAKENILLGNPEIKNTKKMKLAAKQSGAAEFIEKLPKRYNQLLGRQFEGGVELSKGQWQKLAIARAFYESAPILILDEPTSAIDAEAEYEIFRNLDKQYKSKSLLLISHRFSTVRNADKIIVLDEGKIIDEGTHEKLVGKKGLYAEMFMKQAVGYQ